MDSGISYTRAFFTYGLLSYNCTDTHTVQCFSDGVIEFEEIGFELVIVDGLD